MTLFLGGLFNLGIGLNEVPETGISANKFAMMSDIDDFHIRST